MNLSANQQLLLAESTRNGHQFSDAVNSMLTRLNDIRAEALAFVAAWPSHLMNDPLLKEVLNEARQLPTQTQSGFSIVRRLDNADGDHDTTVTYDPISRYAAQESALKPARESVEPSGEKNASALKSPRKRSLVEDDEFPSASSVKKTKRSALDPVPAASSSSQRTPPPRASKPIHNFARVQPPMKDLSRQSAFVAVDRGTHFEMYDEIEGRIINEMLAAERGTERPSAPQANPSCPRYIPSPPSSPVATCAEKPFVNYGPSLHNPTHQLRREATLMAVDHDSHIGLYRLHEGRELNQVIAERKAAEAAVTSSSDNQSSSSSTGKRVRDAEDDEAETSRPTTKPRPTPQNTGATIRASAPSPSPPRRSSRLSAKIPKSKSK